MRLATALLFTSLSFPVAARDCALCGTWRSNEAKTLADIEARVPTYPAGLRKFFGKLTIEYTATTSRAYMAGEQKPEDVPWMPYTLEVRAAGQPSLLRTAGAEGKWMETAIEVRDDCYRVVVPTTQGPGFHEYFCRVAKR